MTAPNTAFSERHPEIARNGSFSRKIGTFRPSFVQTASRSLVENDRPPSFQGAADGGYAARFLAFFVVLGFSRFEGDSTLPPTAANASR